MSLIQEALRRKSVESAPGMHPPAPVAEKSGSSAARRLVPAAVLIVVAGLVWYLHLRLARSPEPDRPPAPEMPAPPEFVSEPVPSPVPAPEPPILEPPPLPLPVVAEPPPVVEAAVEEPAPPAALPDPVAPKTEEGGWPALKLTGVLAGRGEQSPEFAFINGMTVKVGEDLEGVRLLDVESEGAWLEHQGEKKYLLIGRSLP